MENELKYLAMYLDWLGQGYANKEFIVNYKNLCNNYYLLEIMEIPIINTYDSISIQDSNIIISHIGIQTKNLEVTGEMSCSYNPIKIEMNPPEIFSLSSFKESDYFGKMLNQVSDSYENALEKGKELYEKYQASLQPLTYDSTYKLAKTFETSNGEYVEMRVDFMENTIEIDSIHFSTHGEVDFDSITIVDKEEYERLKESSGVLNVLIQSLDKGAAIKKIKNGYIIDDMYYESLEEFLDINEK